MYISLNWLKDYVALPRATNAHDLGEKLTLHTVEVDNIIAETDKFKNVFVGKIIEVNKHPQADKLQIAEVDVNGEKRSIVCGAKNIKPGQKVPVALPGAVLPNGAEIMEAEIRKVKSSGMLCAEDELGLGSDHSGILLLSKNAKSGQKFSDYLDLNDYLFDIDNKSITNRPDLWGHYGLAREISVFLDLKLKDLPVATIDRIKTGKKSENLLPQVEDKKLCLRYMTVTLNNIKVAPSPRWLERRLIAVGVRPINNVVDISNYVMLETGQPLHAFDRQKIDGIKVRRAKDKEKIITLDGEERELDKDMLVIADKKEAIAIAGIMGGANSEIDEESVSVVLESANFDFASIRKTSQRLGLRTDASMRFEKFLDPNLCETALLRAIKLLREVCPEIELMGTINDEKNFILNEKPIILNPGWLKKYIGADINEKRIILILEKLGFKVEMAKDKKNWQIFVPSWRNTKDINGREDIAEEVARIYGYDNIEPRLPRLELDLPKENKELELSSKIRDLLSLGASLFEVENYSFVGEDLLKKLGIDYSNHINILNPISIQHSFLRQNLAPNLFLNIKTNQSRFEKFTLYEIGNVFLPIEGAYPTSDKDSAKLPFQEQHLGIICADNNMKTSYDNVKGSLEYLTDYFGLKLYYEPTENFSVWADPDYAAIIKVDNEIIGSINVLSLKKKKKLGLKKQVSLIEISLPILLKLLSAGYRVNFQVYDKYPPIFRDLAFVLSEKILYNDVKGEIENFHDLIKEVNLFDVYQSDKLGIGRKSLAFHIVYQAERTLIAKEVDKIQKELAAHLEKIFEAKIRDF